MATDDSQDNRGGLIGALANGPGTIASRIVVIIGTPLVAIVAALLAYSIKVTLENIQLEIHQVAVKIDDAADTAKNAEIKVNLLQTDFSRMQEHAAGVDRRLDQIEQRRR